MIRGYFFFFNNTAPTEIYTLSQHDALPISAGASRTSAASAGEPAPKRSVRATTAAISRCMRCSLRRAPTKSPRSEEHTSELQSRQYLVCRLLLEKKKLISAYMPTLSYEHTS